MTTRTTERTNFLRQCQWQNADILSLIPDASFRQYFRLKGKSGNAMLMDAPPETENIDAFINITHHLASLAIRVPAIYAEDREKGFLLLEDLGNQTFTTLLNHGYSADELYQKAVTLLCTIHRHPESISIDLEPYDLNHFIQEARLFTDWYLPATRQKPMDETAIEEYQTCWKEIYTALPELPPTLVLRDFHVDNLMLVQDECAVLDYQDALIGSIAYDMVSLLEDARRDLPADLITQVKNQYFAANPHIDQTAFNQHFAVWGAQRHCKVAGIFVRLWIRDNKPVYLKHLKRVMRLLKNQLKHPTLMPVKHWLEKYRVDSDYTEITESREHLIKMEGLFAI